MEIRVKTADQWTADEQAAGLSGVGRTRKPCNRVITDPRDPGDDRCCAAMTGTCRSVVVT